MSGSPRQVGGAPGRVVHYRLPTEPRPQPHRQCVAVGVPGPRIGPVAPLPNQGLGRSPNTGRSAPKRLAVDRTWPVATEAGVAGAGNELALRLGSSLPATVGTSEPGRSELPQRKKRGPSRNLRCPKESRLGPAGLVTGGSEFPGGGLGFTWRGSSRRELSIRRLQTSCGVGTQHERASYRELLANRGARESVCWRVVDHSRPNRRSVRGSG